MKATSGDVGDVLAGNAAIALTWGVLRTLLAWRVPRVASLASAAAVKVLAPAA